MFSCTRRSSKKIKEKVVFRLQFHATQVPHTSWDRLAVSLVSLDSGRITAKTRRASVRNGQCQWPDALSETIRLVLDTKNMQYDEKLYKFVVAKGSSRSCVLGEVIINMTEYVSAASPLSIALPLRFCYSGSLLHVTIQCLTPKAIEKPFTWFGARSRNDNTDAESELSCRTPYHDFSCKTPCHASPAHGLLRTFSTGPRSPTAASPSGDFSRNRPPSPTSSSSVATEKKSGLIAISYFSLSSPAPVSSSPRAPVSPSLRAPVSPSPRSPVSRAATPKASKQAEHSTDIHIEAAYQWKMFAEKLQEDIEALRAQQASVEMAADSKISTVTEEREILASELAEMRRLNDELAFNERRNCEEIEFVEELKQELEIEKQTSRGLTTQLTKLRDSNLELMLAVREMEESIQERAKDKDARYGMNCKIYNNPCAEGGGALEGDEEIFSEASFTGAETKDKNIDRIIDLNSKGGDGAPAFKVLISAFAEDLKNVRVVLNDLSSQPDSVTGHLMEDLEAVMRGSMSLASQLQEFTGETSKVERDKGELEEKNTQVEKLELRVMSLVAKNVELEKELEGYMVLESKRKVKMDKLEAQLLEFAQELDFMQESNEQLEAAIVEAKSENQRLEKMIREGKPAPECGSGRVSALEAEIKRLEEEKETCFLENCVAENLARDLCEQLHKAVHGDSKPKENEDQPKDFICHLKELRNLFSVLVKNAQASENRVQELESVCDSLEERLFRDHEKAMATISFLDKQFGELSKESDKLIGACKQEVEMILLKLEKEKSQGFLRLALEENVCEIAYLRDELRKLREQVSDLAREKEDIISQAHLEAQRLNAEWETKFTFLKEALMRADASDSELESLKAELAAMNEALAALKEEKIRVELEREELQGKLSGEEEKLSQAQEGFNRAELEAASLRVKNEELLADNEIIKDEARDLLQSLNCLKLEKKSLEAKLKMLNAEVDELHDQNASSGHLEDPTLALQADLEQHGTLIKELEQELARLETKLRSEAQSHKEARSLCVKLTEEKERSKASLQEFSHAESKLDFRLQKFQETTEAKLHALELDSQSCRQASQAKASLISEKLSILEAAYKQTKISYDAVTFELEQCKNKNSELEQIIQKAQVHQLEVSEAIAASRKGKEPEEELHSKEDQMTEESLDEARVRRKWRIQHDDESSEINRLREKVASLEIDLSSKVLHSSIEKSREREAILCEKIVHLEVSKRLLEGEAEDWKLVRSNLEENIKRFESELEMATSKYQNLKKENEELKSEISKWELEKEQLTKKVQLLEREASELLTTVSSKEAEASAKQLELAFVKQELQDKENFLWKKIEYLEIANEQLAFQQADSDVDQLKKELTRLQNHNSELILREHELSSKLSTHTLLQVELQRLQEENEQLEQNFLKLKESSHWGDTVERLVYLEAELSEALETNNIYKLQLQNIFWKQERGQDVGDVEEMVGNLVRFKKQTSFLEKELKEIQERYLNMSMKFAELQTEREELLMTVKALRSSR